MASPILRDIRPDILNASTAVIEFLCDKEGAYEDKIVAHVEFPGTRYNDGRIRSKNCIAASMSEMRKRIEGRINIESTTGKKCAERWNEPETKFFPVDQSALLLKRMEVFAEEHKNEFEQISALNAAVNIVSYSYLMPGLGEKSQKALQKIANTVFKKIEKQSPDLSVLKGSRKAGPDLPKKGNDPDGPTLAIM